MGRTPAPVKVTAEADALSDSKALARPGAAVQVSRRSLGSLARDYIGSFLFVVPYLLFFIAFLLGPLIYAFVLSVNKWSTLTGNQGFIGLKNYSTILFDRSSLAFSHFWGGLGNTLIFVVISVPLLVLVSLILALLLAEAPWRSFFRGLFYVPSVLSVALACTVWLWIFQNGGLLSTYLHTSVTWLSSQPWAWMAIIVTTLWWTIGFNMVILLAGVIEVPKDYHEAAKIDGANGLQRILYITIPILRPILAFVIITQALASFGLFGQPYILTAGGPGESTTPILLWIYKQAFESYDLGIAAAMSFALGVIIIAISVIQLRVFRAGEA